MVIVGVDTGGTFTDLIFKFEAGWQVYKLLSTPADPAAAVLQGLQEIAATMPLQIVHGSTVATNAILERKGAKTALITNQGFEDVIEIGRQNRSRLYDLSYKKEEPMVPAELRFGVRGRILHTGEVLQDLDREDAQIALHQLREAGVESVAVCFLFSYVNPLHEEEMSVLLEHLHLPASLSHEILAEFREFERTSTTVINAYVTPVMKKYLTSLEEALGSKDRLRIMQSNGGSISAQTAKSQSVRTILSGPAGGAVGAFELGKLAGYEKLISFDMGGTSTDVSLIDGRLSYTLDSKISGYPLKVPMIDIHTVGAGGGSIACLDSGGALRVGPQSAGADPGPICYGKGNRITVTDANLYLGRLVPDYFLGGQMRLRPERLEQHFREMSKETGLSPLELADGILSVANAAMERAIRVISVERGHDPHDFTLLAFGGAGGVHAAYLARLLNIPRVLIPPNPGILSALGMLMADVVRDYSLTVMLRQADADEQRLTSLFVPLENKGMGDLVAEGIDEGRVVLHKYLDMRYRGQSHEIMVPFQHGFVGLFHGLHAKIYGYGNSEKPVEVVNLRLKAVGVPEKPEFHKATRFSAMLPGAALIDTREVIFDGAAHRTRVINRHRLLSGNKIQGPAVIAEYSATVVIPPFAGASLDQYGNLVMEIQ